MTRLRRRAAALLAALALGGAVVVAAAAPASAESISDLQVQATVNADTTFQVSETITYDFEYEYRHGIFRDIPVYDETITGMRRQYGITVESITMDGQPIPWVTSDNGPFLNVKIGDPNVTISGPHVYRIDYTVSNGLRVITTDDLEDPAMPDNLSAGDVELYWDWVGNGWEVPIANAQARVLGPGEVLHTACYSGAFGGTSDCPTAAVKGVALYGPVRLQPGESLTGVTVYPAAAFSRPPVEDISQGLPTNPLVGIGGGLIPAALLIAVPVGIAISRRREDLGAPVPGAPPQYAPPDGLAPAELAAAWHGTKDASDARPLVATLLDLAARRWLNVTTVDGHLSITWTGTGTTPLRPWENAVLSIILQGQYTATLSGYDKAMTSLWNSEFHALVSAAEASGRRNPRGGDPDKRWRWLGLVCVAAFALGFASLFLGVAFITWVAFTTAVGALIGFIAARIITPRRETPQSARFLAEIGGFRKVLGTDAAASRREFAQRLGLPPEAIFATMLPYAVVFDLENSWIGAFPDLSGEQLMAHGFYVGSISSMNGLVSSSTTSMSSAMTAPSSGSGSGGSSGGGGGGGGGGSW